MNNETPLQEEERSEENSRRSEPTAGSKRPRDDGDRERDTRRQPDPTNAPDPDEPEEFDETVLRSLVDDQFQQPEDDSIVTLDRCECLYVAACSLLLVDPLYFTLRLMC